MKKTILYLVIYLIGCVWCYMDAKREWINTFKEHDKNYVYTVDHRNPNLFVSLLSWGGVIFFEFKYRVYDKIDKSEPANW